MAPASGVPCAHSGRVLLQSWQSKTESVKVMRMNFVQGLSNTPSSIAPEYYERQSQKQS
ncbi:MAG: hypothetical protein U0175_11320 [Caldilineaceae bacterium]